MPTWITCKKCGRIQELTLDATVPSGWREVGSGLQCPTCTDTSEDGATSDVIDEEIIYPSTPDTLDEDEDVDGFCTVCKGPCQGH